MKRFCLAIASCVNLFCVDVLHGASAGVASLKSDLNAEFGRQVDDSMFLVTVVRTPLRGFTPLISHNEFEQVLRLLYASCVDPGCWLTRW